MKSHRSSRRPKYLVVTQSKQLRCRTSARTVCLSHCGTTPALCARALVSPPHVLCARKVWFDLASRIWVQFMHTQATRLPTLVHPVPPGWYRPFSNTPVALVFEPLEVPALNCRRAQSPVSSFGHGRVDSGTLSRCMSLAIKDWIL